MTTLSLTPISRGHFAMLCQYSGISFISGAVNHGFFSGPRSLMTAALGVALFVVGAVMEHRTHAARDALAHDTSAATNPSLLKTLLLGAVLSIGLGFFTGGLQHFPDSPERSSWVVPLGFALSVWALGATLGARWIKSSLLYAAIGTVLVAAGSLAARQYYAASPMSHNNQGHQSLHNHHGMGASAATQTPSTADNASTQAYKAANDAMHKGMDIAFTGDADADFLAGMIPHHQGAIDMARVVLTHGKDPKIKALAQQIIAAQEKEIADMSSWSNALPATSKLAAPKPAAIAGEDHSKHKH
jgi:Domain of unknown function (DUF305)